jgi:hypothetical protein
LQPLLPLAWLFSIFSVTGFSELGVPLKEGYNGDLTSKQAGSIGGEMVKQMIMKQEQQMK